VAFYTERRFSDIFSNFGRARNRGILGIYFNLPILGVCGAWYDDFAILRFFTEDFQWRKTIGLSVSFISNRDRIYLLVFLVELT